MILKDRLSSCLANFTNVFKNVPISNKYYLTCSLAVSATGGALTLNSRQRITSVDKTFINRTPVFCNHCREKVTANRNIPCGHSFCTACIKEHTETYEQNYILNCPICLSSSTVFGGNAGSLNLNDWFCDLKSLSLNDDSDDVDIKICCSTDGCSENVAVNTCVTGCDDLCAECTQTHSVCAITAKHNVSPISLATKAPTKECIHHTGQTANMFCDDCFGSICQICLLSTHSQHKCTRFDEKIGSLYQELDHMQDKVKVAFEEFQKTKLALSSGQMTVRVRKDIDDAKEKVRLSYKQLHSLLDEEEQTKLYELEMIYTGVEDQITTFKLKQSQLEEELNSIISCADYLKTKSKQDDLGMNVSRMRNKLKDKLLPNINWTFSMSESDASQRLAKSIDSKPITNEAMLTLAEFELSHSATDITLLQNGFLVVLSAQAFHFYDQNGEFKQAIESEHLSSCKGILCVLSTSFLSTHEEYIVTIHSSDCNNYFDWYRIEVKDGKVRHTEKERYPVSYNPCSIESYEGSTFLACDPVFSEIHFYGIFCNFIMKVRHIQLPTHVNPVNAIRDGFGCYLVRTGGKYQSFFWANNRGDITRSFSDQSLSFMTDIQTSVCGGLLVTHEHHRYISLLKQDGGNVRYFLNDETARPDKLCVDRSRGHLWVTCIRDDGKQKLYKCIAPSSSSPVTSISVSCDVIKVFSILAKLDTSYDRIVLEKKSF